MTDIIAPLPVLPEWAAGKINLASPRLGAEAIACSDAFFAPMHRMLSDAPAVFKTDVYDDNGKWMDGWESRRRRNDGHDWCIVRLGVQGRISGVNFDTSHFTGNFPPAASLWACLCDGAPDETTEWVEVVPATGLSSSDHHFALSQNDGVFSHVRLNLYPDGGMARLRVYGDPVPDWEGQDKDKIVELSALRNGGRVVGYNNAHYGEVWALLSEGRGLNMGDGWETRRRREPGNDWLIVALGAVGNIDRIEIDTAHFKGNFPDRASIQAANVEWGNDDSVVTQAMFWREVLAEQKLSADTVHTFFNDDLTDIGPVTHVKLNIFPDGGVSRLRIFGKRK